MEATVKDIQQNAISGTDVFEELAERDRRATNIIIFDMKESTCDDRKVREERDKGGLLQLFKEIEVNTTLDQVKLVRREGERKEGTSRPLKVVFRRKDDRDIVLSNAYKLARAREEVWQNVSIKADLTRNQKDLERDLEKNSASKT